MGDRRSSICHLRAATSVASSNHRFSTSGHPATRHPDAAGSLPHYTPRGVWSRLRVGVDRDIVWIGGRHMPESILWEHVDGVARLTINRPERRNALDAV